MSTQASREPPSSPPELVPSTPSSSPRSPQEVDVEEPREGKQKGQEPAPIKKGTRTSRKLKRNRLLSNRKISKGKSNDKDPSPKADSDGKLVDPTTDDAKSEEDLSVAASNKKAEPPKGNMAERARSRWSPRRLMRRPHEDASTNSHQTRYGGEEKKNPLWVRSGTVHWVKAGSQQNTALTEQLVPSDCSTNPALDGTQSTRPSAPDDNPLLAQSNGSTEDKAWYHASASQRQEIISSDGSIEVVLFDTTKETDETIEPPPAIRRRTTESEGTEEATSVTEPPKQPTTKSKSVRFSDEVFVLGYGSYEGKRVEMIDNPDINGGNGDVLPMSLCLGGWMGDIGESDSSKGITVVDMTGDSFSEFSVGIAVPSNQLDRTNRSEKMLDEDVALLSDSNASGRMSPLSLDDCPANRIEESLVSATESIDLSVINLAEMVGDDAPSSMDYPISRRGRTWAKIVDFARSLLAVLVYISFVAIQPSCIGHPTLFMGVNVAGAVVLCCFSCFFTKNKQRKIGWSKLLEVFLSRKTLLLLLYLMAWHYVVNLALRPWCHCGQACRSVSMLESHMSNLRSPAERGEVGAESQVEETARLLSPEALSPVIAVGNDSMFTMQPFGFEGDASMLPARTSDSEEDARTADGARSSTTEVGFDGTSEHEMDDDDMTSYGVSGDADKAETSHENLMHFMDADKVQTSNALVIDDEETPSKIEDLPLGASESVFDKTLSNSGETSIVGGIDTLSKQLSVVVTDAVYKDGFIGAPAERRLSNADQAKYESVARTPEGHVVKTGFECRSDGTVSIKNDCLTGALAERRLSNADQAKSESVARTPERHVEKIDFEFESRHDGAVSIMNETTPCVRRLPPRSFFTVPFLTHAWRKDSGMKVMSPLICEKPPPYLSHIPVGIAPFQPPSSMSMTNKPNGLKKGAAMARTAAMVRRALQHSAAFWIGGEDGKYNNQEMIDALAELWNSQLWA